MTAGATGQCGSIPAANYSTDTPNVAYAYDSGISNAKGRLVSATTSAAVNQISGYDPLGQVTGSSQIIGGLTYSFGYAYNRAGVLTSMTYPSGRVIATGYDGANRPNSLTGTKNGAPTTYLSGLSYASHGGFRAFTLGNQLTRSHSYNNRLQPTELTDRVPSQSNPLLDLQYFYGGSTVLNGSSTLNNGNITQINIGASLSGTTSASFTQTYGYDRANRLQTAGETGSGAWSEQFGYDRYGNMWLSSASGLFTQPLMPSSQSSYTNPPTNQLVSVTYDGAGNQLALGGAQLAYDSENRQVSATDTTSGRTTTYRYDGLGERVSKSAGSMPTAYVYDVFGNLAAEYGSSPISSCTTCYLSWDHLGSTRTMTDQNGQVISRHDYLPFGSEIPTGYAGRTSPWGGNDLLAQKFTSQERDPETGADFFQARYMGSPQGRFLGADPANAGADPANPQSWHLYSYVLNNPVNAIDPDGLDSCDSGDDSCDWGWDFGLGIWPPWWTPAGPNPSSPPVPTTQSRIPTNATGVYGTGGDPWSGGPFSNGFTDPNSVELHHVFSQELRAWFEAQGIDIDQFLIALPAGLHRLKAYGGLHTGKNNWNALWKQFRAANDNATKEKMFNYARQLIDKFKIVGYPGANLEIPLVFVDICKIDPRQSVCNFRPQAPPTY